MMKCSIKPLTITLGHSKLGNPSNQLDFASTRLHFAVSPCVHLLPGDILVASPPKGINRLHTFYSLLKDLS